MLVLVADDRRQKLAVDTLDELEWCLEQLETVQTHRSVSDMATSKVHLICWFIVDPIRTCKTLSIFEEKYAYFNVFYFRLKRTEQLCPSRPTSPHTITTFNLAKIKKKRKKEKGKHVTIRNLHHSQFIILCGKTRLSPDKRYPPKYIRTRNPKAIWEELLRHRPRQFYVGRCPIDEGNDSTWAHFRASIMYYKYEFENF